MRRRAMSSIEWTDITVNPIRARDTKTGKLGWYCEKVSTGCKHCYAETLNQRNLPGAGTGRRYGEKRNLEIILVESVLQKVLRMRKPKWIFWCSMTDVFGPFVPDEMIDKIMAVCALTPYLTHQILTKRPERMAEYFNGMGLVEGIHGRSWRIREAGHAIADHIGDDVNFALPLPNAHLGTSVENQATADERIPHLLQCPAAARWLSCEPLLGAIEFTRQSAARAFDDMAPGTAYPIAQLSGLEHIDWVVIGGESGPGARPCNIEDVRSIRDQCRAAGVRVFIKQLGANPIMDGIELKLKDRKGGKPDEWPTDLRVREMPQ